MHYRQRLGIAAIWTTAYLVLAGGLLGSLSATAFAETKYTFSFCVEGGSTATSLLCTASNTYKGAFATLYGDALDNSTETLAEDPSKGDLYVADGGTPKVVDRFSPAGVFECELNVSTTSSPKGCEPAKTTTAFTTPTGVGVGPKGEVYVADEGRKVVDKFSSSGAFECELGSLAADPCDGAASDPATAFATLYSIVVGPSSEGSPVYVDNETSTSAGIIDKFNGSTGAYEGDITATTNIGAGQTWDVATPGDLAVDSHGNVYVVSLSSPYRVVVFNASGVYQSELSVGSEPTAVAVNPANNDVYVGLGTKVAVYHAASEVEVAGVKKWVIPGSSEPEPKPITTFGSSAYGCSTGCKALSTTTGLAVSREALHPLVYASDKTGKDVDVFEQQIAPTPVTGAAIGMTGTTAVLTGTVNPEGVLATSTFEYGTSTCATTCGTNVSTIPSSDGNGSSPVTVNAELTGLVPNTTYHYWLKASNVEALEHGSEAIFQTPVIVPTVNDQPPNATSIEPPTGTVRFCGTINPEHAEGKYHFVFGTTSSYGQETEAVETGTEYGDLEVCQTAEGLLPSTTYHFVLAAEDAAGPVQGPDYTFTTAPALIRASEPGVQTGAASGITQSTATISGTVDPNGLPTTYAFELGSSTAYGTVIYGYAGEGNLPSGGAGQLAESVTLALSDLAPGSTYHYRLVAFNGAGASYGVDQTFTTPDVAGVFARPLTPAFVATPMFGAVKETVTSTKKTKSKPLTKAQKLTRALKGCKKYKATEKRRKCEQQAHRKYMTKKKAKATATKQTGSEADRRVK